MNSLNKIMTLTICIFVVISCGHNDERVIEGESPIRSIKLTKHGISITSDHKSHLSDFIDISVFKGVAPEMTLTQTEQIIGNPTRVDGNEQTYIAEFWFDSLRIEVQIDNENDLAPVLRAIPKNMSIDDFFIPQVTELVRKEWDETLAGKTSMIIQIDVPNDSLFAWIELTKTNINYIDLSKIF